MSWRQALAQILADRPELAVGSNEDIAAAINAAVDRRPVPIEYADLMLWAAAGAAETQPSRVVRCRLAAERQAPYQTISHAAHGAAIASVALFSGSQPQLTWYAPQQSQLIQTLVAAGVFSSEEIAELINTYGYCESPLWQAYSGGTERVDAGNVAAVRGTT